MCDERRDCCQPDRRPDLPQCVDVESWLALPCGGRDDCPSGLVCCLSTGQGMERVSCEPEEFCHTSQPSVEYHTSYGMTRRQVCSPDSDPSDCASDSCVPLSTSWLPPVSVCVE